MSELGLITVAKVNDLPPDQGAMYRMRIKNTMLDNGWVPLSGPADDLFTVVGEAPGYQEVKQRRPFVGASGQLLRRELRAVGLEPYDVFYCNVVPFWPTEQSGEPNQQRQTRPPKDIEIKGGRALFMRQLTVPRSQRMLLVGATALKAFRPDLKLADVHGQCFIWNSRWVVMPTYHPAAALRSDGMYVALKHDLKRWADVIAGGEGHWHRYLTTLCCRCGGYMRHMDGDAVGFCEKHWDNGVNAKLAKTYWNLPPEQLTLDRPHSQDST